VNTREGAAAVTRYGCGRVSHSEGQERRGEREPRDENPISGWEDRASGAGNATNPRIGSGMQQARDLWGSKGEHDASAPCLRTFAAEEAVEVVRNHEDGA
jgi:hypothetical protein